ncbi:MAG TPA: hypothetical protein VIR27_18325, partial [Mycobacteriales bacterium]
AEAAVAEFGDPALLASALVPELAAGHARRTTLALVRSGPAVGVLWVLAWAVAHPVPAGWVVPWPPWSGSVGTDGTVPDPRLFAPAVGMFLLTALVVLASTGRAGRWLPHRPGLAPAAAVAGAVICVACDLAVLSLLAGQVGSVRRSAAWAPLVVAAAASLTRLVLTARAGRRLLALRAALPVAR